MVAPVDEARRAIVYAIPQLCLKVVRFREPEPAKGWFGTTFYEPELGWAVHHSGRILVVSHYVKARIRPSDILGAYRSLEDLFGDRWEVY